MEADGDYYMNTNSTNDNSKPTDEQMLLNEFKDLILEVSRETINISLVNDIKETEKQIRDNLLIFNKLKNETQAIQVVLEKNKEVTLENIKQVRDENQILKQKIEIMNSEIHGVRNEISTQMLAVNKSFQYVSTSLTNLNNKLSSIEGKLSRFETMTNVKNGIQDMYDKFSKK